MKGRQLTLEEVLNLEDGTKVWVEDEGDKQIGVVDTEDSFRIYVDDESSWYEVDELSNYGVYVTFYEWIEESDLTADDSISIIARNHSDTIKDMAQEICNLRGINLTEDNIDKVRMHTRDFSRELVSVMQNS